MNEANEQEEPKRLRSENVTLNAECDRLESELKRSDEERQMLHKLNSALRRQLTSAQQQIASLSMKLAEVKAVGTEPMMSIGPNEFDPTMIAAVHWDPDYEPGPALCIDRIPVWWPMIYRPEVSRRDRYETEEAYKNAEAFLAEWERVRSEAKAKIVDQVNRAKRAIAEQRRRSGKAKKREAEQQSTPKAPAGTSPAEPPQKTPGRRGGKTQKISL